MRVKSITFRNVTELINKAEDIKKAFEANSKELREGLISEGVPFIRLDDFSIYVDKSDLTEEAALMVNRYHSNMESDLRLLGVSDSVDA